MAHKPRWKHGAIPQSWFLLIFLSALVIVYFGRKVELYWYSSFFPQKLTEDSFLNGRVFKGRVQEIKAPKTGLKAYLLEENTNPIVSLSFVFTKAGTSADDIETTGWTNLAVSMLGEGTQQLDSRALKEKLSESGIHISFSAGLNDINGNLTTPKIFLSEAENIMRDVLTAPRLENHDMERIRNQIIAALKKQNENPTAVLRLAENDMLYKAHPYGWNPLGNSKNLKMAESKDLQKLLLSRLGQDNLIIGIAGNVTVDEAGKMIDNIFSGLPLRADFAAVTSPEVSFKGKKKHIFRKLKQSLTAFSGQGTYRQADDFYALYIANYIFGGAGLNSRISKAVREKEGLVYSIYSYLSFADNAPQLHVGFSTTPDNHEKVMALLAYEAQSIRRGVTQKEFESAKNYLISSYNLRFADIDGIADMLAYMQRENLGADFLQKRNDYVAAVSLEEVNAAAAKYFDMEEMSVISIGEQEE